jgi:hypothetical protein
LPILAIAVVVILQAVGCDEPVWIYKDTAYHNVCSASTRAIYIQTARGQQMA